VIIITTTPVPPVGGPAGAPAATQVVIDCHRQEDQPVALRLANTFNASYDEIEGWHCRGFGFGEITRAYLLAWLSDDDGNVPITVNQIFVLRLDKKGWGEIIKMVGVQPNDLAQGQVIKLKGKDDKDHNDDGPLGRGHKGKGKGNGKGNDDKGKKDKGGKGNMGDD